MGMGMDITMQNCCIHTHTHDLYKLPIPLTFPGLQHTQVGVFIPTLDH